MHENVVAEANEHLKYFVQQLPGDVGTRIRLAGCLWF